MSKPYNSCKEKTDKDRTYYKVWDSQDNVIFTVGAKGQVVRNLYDEENNLRVIWEVAKWLTYIPDNYDELVAALNSLPDYLKNDRATEKLYDKQTA